MVPALQRYTNLTTQSIVATSLAVIAVVSVAGVAASAVTGHLQWAIALPFAAGALGGMIAGRLIASKLSGPHLQKAFALVSATVAVALFEKQFELDNLTLVLAPWPAYSSGYASPGNQVLETIYV